MRYLVTGATGFVGRNLVSALLAAGNRVTSVVRRDDPGLPGDIVTMTNPLNAADYREIASRIDVVVNLIAAGVHPGERDPHLLYRANASFPAELALECASAGVRFFIHLGSCAEYARPVAAEALSELSPLEDVRLYGVTKAAGSLGVQAACRATGMEGVILRAFNVFGPGEGSHRLFPSVATRIAARERIAMSAGLQVRDFVYIDDVCAAIERVARSLADGRIEPGIYNLGTGHGVTVADFARTVLDVMGGDEMQLDLGAIPMRPDEIPYVVASPTKLERVIGRIATHDLRESILRGITRLGLEGVSP